MTLFPQLIAGPIVRYQTVVDELEHRDCTADLFADGVKRFACGIGKKVLLANTAGHGPLKICSPKQEKCIN
ncbi:MAG: hypothetical protein PUF98_02460 [Oscillibacter sp.]|nr:hypothetical protein [Oscillibacter sp.]